MKKYPSFLSENFQFLEVKFSIYLNRCVFVMLAIKTIVNFRCSSKPYLRYFLKVLNGDLYGPLQRMYDQKKMQKFSLCQMKNG